jgi:cobalt/nickel transport system permease protein
MHMADALLSPAVGGTMWAATAGLIGYCSKKVKEDLDENRIPLMGVVGAFIFAAQMINFTIPATGSSGHLGGGLILAILLGPHAAFLTMASVLAVQALFFADGGLLALGANIFNLGFLPCFIAYPFIFKPLAGSQPRDRRLVAVSILAAVVSLQLGALGVVLETVISGISELPFGTFLLFMLPIHLAIGLVEGIVTALVVLFVRQARPELIAVGAKSGPHDPRALRKLLVGFAAATVVVGGALSWFASTHPDGLEWSMFQTAGTEELENAPDGLQASLSHLQEKTAFMPDYGFKTTDNDAEGEAPAAWPAVDAGTTTAGLVGGLITFLVAALIGLALRRRHRTA